MVMSEGGLDSMDALRAQLEQAEKARDAAVLRAERAEALADMFFESPLVGHVEVGLDGHFVRVNARMLSLTGYRQEQLLEMGPFDVTPKEGHEALRGKLAELREGVVASILLRKDLRRQDGSAFSNQATVQLLRDLEGKVKGMLGSFLDTTEAHDLRVDRDTREALFQAVAQQSKDGISIITDDGNRLLVNEGLCRMLGYSEEELLAGRVEDVLEGGEDALEAVDRDADSTRFEVTFLRKDGTSFVAEVSSNRISVGGRNLRLAFVHDITSRVAQEKERLALETQIQQAQKLESLGVLAGGIAHDFNNLLVGILGNAELALYTMSVESPSRDSVQDIVTAAERAADLVRQMLAYAGKGRFVIEKLHINRLVEEMAHLLEVSISKKAVLRYEFGHDLPLIEADATQVRQIVMNLITNASDAIGDRSGVISICTGAMDCDHDYLSETYLDDDLPEGQYVYIEVSDTGVGLDLEARGRIFDPFYSTKFTGRGLGLAAVLGIVRGHRGAVKLYSEPGRGTTFKVLFPASKMSLEERANQERGDRGSFEGIVLLVDDEETVRSVGKRMLERLGFRVETATDGRDALQKFRVDPKHFDVVLLDLTMPHMDGDACFRELRRVKPKVRVILSSGYNQQELTTRFAGKGLAGFIQKPYRMKTLRDAFAKVLDAAIVTDTSGNDLDS